MRASLKPQLCGHRRASRCTVRAVKCCSIVVKIEELLLRHTTVVVLPIVSGRRFGHPLWYSELTSSGRIGLENSVE